MGRPALTTPLQSALHEAVDRAFRHPSLWFKWVIWPPHDPRYCQTALNTVVKNRNQRYMMETVLEKRTLYFRLVPRPTKNYRTFAATFTPSNLIGAPHATVDNHR